MTKDIKTVISKYFPQIQLNIALINSNTLDKMFPLKDKIPYLCCSCVIYKYQCDQCSSSYIGETQKKKKLKYRIFQHKVVVLLLLSTPGSSDSGPCPRYPRSRPIPASPTSGPAAPPGSTHSASGPRSVDNLGQLIKCLVLCGCLWHRGQFGVFLE